MTETYQIIYTFGVKSFRVSHFGRPAKIPLSRERMAKSESLLSHKYWSVPTVLVLVNRLPSFSTSLQHQHGSHESCSRYRRVASVHDECS